MTHRQQPSLHTLAEATAATQPSSGGQVRLRWTRRARIRFGSTTQLRSMYIQDSPVDPLRSQNPTDPIDQLAGRATVGPCFRLRKATGQVAEDQPRTVAVLHIGRVDYSSQQQSRGSNHHLPCPITLLSTHSHEAPFCRRLDRLAVADGDTGRRVSPCCQGGRSWATIRQGHPVPRIERMALTHAD